MPSYPCVLHLEDCTHMEAEEKTKLTELFDELGTPDDERIIKETHLVISNDMKQDVAAVEHFLDLLIDTLKKRNPNLSTMYAQSDGCKAQFKNSSFYLWISSQQEKTGVRVDWCYFCSCHGKCDCDPEGGAAKHAVAQQQLRDNMDERTRISTYEDLIQFLMAEFQTPTKSIYQKKGKGIWRRFIHWVPSDSISRDILYAEYSLKLSDPYRQITDVGEPGEVRCRHRSCHQCQVDDSSAVVGDCMHLDVKKCKNNHHCGIAQQRALSAMQLEFDEAAWAKRALALQVQAQLIGHGEIIVVMNDDPEHGAQEPFFLGEAAALYDTKAGEAGIAYAWELGDQETIFGRMCNNDVVLDIIKYEPVKVGSNLYERTAKRFPVYVESICVRNVRLEAVGNKVKLAQGESNRILLAVPRETWFYREMASRPWDPRLVKAGDIEYVMQVSQQLLNKSICPFLRVLSFFRVVHTSTVPSAIY